MANLKNLRKAAAKFRRTEPIMHSICQNAIDYMADFIKKSNTSEVTVRIHNNKIIGVYASSKY